MAKLRLPVIIKPDIVDATPARELIAADQITGDTFITASGFSLAVSEKGERLLRNRLIHDKLKLGVAAMVVSLLSSI